MLQHVKHRSTCKVFLVQRVTRHCCVLSFQSFEGVCLRKRLFDCYFSNKKRTSGVSLRVAVLCFLSSPLGGAAVTDGGTILRLTGWIVHIKTKTILRHWRDAE